MNHNILVDITDASELALNGEPLPGVFQSLEVSGDLRVDSAKRPGRSGAAKLAEGWEDMRLVLRLLLPSDEPGSYAESSARRLAQLFQRADGNAKPFVYTIAHPIAAALNLNEVLFRAIRIQSTNEGDAATAEVEFLEFRPMMVKRERSRRRLTLGGAIDAGLGAAPAAIKAAADKVGGGVNGAVDAADWFFKAAAGKLGTTDKLYNTLPKGSNWVTAEVDSFVVTP